MNIDKPSMKPIPSEADFDPASGSWLERLIFNNRLVILLLCGLLTLGLAAQFHGLKLNASFERMLPTAHPFIQNYLKYKGDLASQGNVIRVIVERADGGSILDPAYLETLRKVSDEVYLIAGVNRPFMKSLWTPTMRWIGVTEEGVEGGRVLDKFDGSPQALDRLRVNIERSGEIGQIVAPDFKSSLLLVPLLDRDTETGAPLDYGRLSEKLEEVRAKYQGEKINIRIVGFAKIVGDLIDGLQRVLGFFALAAAIATVIVYAYTRCVRSTALVVVCSLIAVLWQLGALPLLGLELDPYSILVPFLVFAIGMSHGAQKMNGVMQDIGRGMSNLMAARFTFRRLFMAGFAALMCDAVGFAVLLLIDIPVIQQLAVVASLGVAILVFSNLIVLPVLLSYTGVSPTAAQRSLQSDSDEPAHGLWHLLECFTQRRVAAITLAATALLGAAGWLMSLKLEVGDLDPGAPELRVDSRYNRDNAYLTAHYATSSDSFIVMVTSPADRCMDYDKLKRVDELEWMLRQTPGVAGISSTAGFARNMARLYSENNPKWAELIPNQSVLNNFVQLAPRDIANSACSLSMLRVFLDDHKAETLRRMVAVAQDFAERNSSTDQKFLLAAGNGGIEAATNIVVQQASRSMLLWVYGAVVLLCLVTFRDWRAVVCAVLPLMLTSVLAEALMASLGIGVKVATLPVIALGVGIGVDYALYVLSVMRAHLNTGASLAQAYRQALRFTGRVVLLTGITLSVAVATWTFSPIKFQADMGILLAFCFLFNMIGALVVLPALASFLLTPAPDKSQLAVADRVSTIPTL